MAVEACAAERFDVILMDLQMPRDGRLRGDPRHPAARGTTKGGGAPRTPIVALTARASRGNEDLCFASGFDGYLAKPYRSRELVDAIAAVVSTSEPAAAPQARSAGPLRESRLDWDSALETVDGDRELLGKMLEGFLGQQPALVAELREAFRTDDLPVVKRVAHTIGGSLRSFDGARVVALANDLEDHCRAGSTAEAAAAWDALEPELAEVVVDLRDWVRKQQ